ncbi:hypothetical protein [Rouxiella sp. WC2420]|uniref:WH2 domain-containing protein n=1 Tax=Rouxiella sp. WC2420 TaxID=3234145 RepID=A0AB39VT47_9GAMM
MIFDYAREGNLLRIYKNTPLNNQVNVTPYQQVKATLQSSNFCQAMTTVRNIPQEEISFNKDYMKLLNNTRARYEALYADIDEVQNSFGDNGSSSWRTLTVKEFADKQTQTDAVIPQENITPRIQTQPLIKESTDGGKAEPKKPLHGYKISRLNMINPPAVKAATPYGQKKVSFKGLVDFYKDIDNVGKYESSRSAKISEPVPEKPPVVSKPPVPPKPAHLSKLQKLEPEAVPEPGLKEFSVVFNQYLKSKAKIPWTNKIIEVSREQTAPLKIETAPFDDKDELKSIKLFDKLQQDFRRMRQRNGLSSRRIV